MTDNSPIRIFISYAREDYPIARKLYDDLKARGFCPWMDKVDLLIGQNWKTMTTRAIKECDYFLALMSNHSLGKRGYVQREMKKALDILGEFPDDEIFFLPVRIDECRPENEILQDINWANLFPSYDEGFGDILRTLNAKMNEKAAVQQSSPMIEGPHGMKFALIKAGTFMMGSPEDELGRRDNETLHRVTITRDFYMGITQVTQGQWKAVMGGNPSRFKDCGDNGPVEMVSWDKVQGFIERLNASEGRKIYRLPTEAEWEYACRAGTTTRYYTGNTEADLDRAGWYDKNSGDQLHPVGHKEPNDWGLYDMHGNVWEWCQDWYGDYPSESVADPHGPDSGVYRVVRGGSWGVNAAYCRSALRYGGSPVFRDSGLGFRLLRSSP